VHFSSSCARHSSKKTIRIPQKVATFARFPNPKPQESVNPVISKAPESRKKNSVFESSWEIFPDCFSAAEQCERTMGRRWHAVAAVGMAFAAAVLAVAVDGGFPLSLAGAEVAPLPQEEMSMLQKLAYLMFEKDGTSYQHVWPVINFMLCISQILFFTRVCFCLGLSALLLDKCSDSCTPSLFLDSYTFINVTGILTS
jgi:hypothetical protein